MNDFLLITVILLAFIVLLGYFNEKITKLTYEISLMLFSAIIGGILVIIGVCFKNSDVNQVLDRLQLIDLESFLLEGILCFMLFAGSCHAKLLDFKKFARPISLLAIVTTLLGAVFYGLLFFAAGKLLRLNLSLPVCLMFGSIVAPTDPIAATSILKKFNLPSGVGFVIEGESLLNDGVGVALFVCFSGMVTASKGGGFVTIMLKELFGAILVGVVVTAICFPIFKHSKDDARRIFTSLLAVALAYLLCEFFGFSGAIASVVCGVLFSALRNYNKQKKEPLELEKFDTFWEILDNLFNSLLYVILGLSFVQIIRMPHVFLLSLIAVVINLISRSGSVFISSLLAGPLPDGYTKGRFVTLLTWGGLRGGLSVALAMSTKEILNESTYHIILGCTFALVFFTTIIQGLTMPKVYNKIK